MRVVEAVKRLSACSNFKTDFMLYILISAISVFLLPIEPDFIKTGFNFSMMPLFIIYSIVTFFLMSYVLTTLRFAILGKDEFLPVWSKDFKGIIKTGFKYAVGLLVYFLILFILGAITVGLIKIKAGIFTVLFGLFTFIACVLFAYNIIGIQMYYCTKLKLSAMFNLAQVSKMIKAGGKKYFKMLLVVYLLNLPASLFGSYALSHKWFMVIITIYSAFVGMIAMILYGGYFREILEVEKAKTAEN